MYVLYIVRLCTGLICPHLLLQCMPLVAVVPIELVDAHNLKSMSNTLSLLGLAAFHTLWLCFTGCCNQEHKAGVRVHVNQTWQ